MKLDQRAKPLVLASLSPRREALLKTLSLPFQVVGSGVDEELDEGVNPSAAVAVLSNRKALAVAEGCPDRVVLAADTVIDFQGSTLGKPSDDLDAERMLRTLRGQAHRVITGIVVLRKNADLKLVSVVSTEVRMRDYSDLEIRDYVATGEPRDKAGSYAIQGDGGRLIEGIRGCYNNVIGLPLCETVELLRTQGILLDPESICQLPSGDPCPRSGKGGSDD